MSYYTVQSKALPSNGPEFSAVQEEVPLLPRRQRAARRGMRHYTRLYYPQSPQSPTTSPTEPAPCCSALQIFLGITIMLMIAATATFVTLFALKVTSFQMINGKIAAVIAAPHDVGHPMCPTWSPLHYRLTYRYQYQAQNYVANRDVCLDSQEAIAYQDLLTTGQPVVILVDPTRPSSSGLTPLRLVVANPTTLLYGGIAIGTLLMTVTFTALCALARYRHKRNIDAPSIQ